MSRKVTRERQEALANAKDEAKQEAQDAIQRAKEAIRRLAFGDGKTPFEDAFLPEDTDEDPLDNAPPRKSRPK